MVVEIAERLQAMEDIRCLKARYFRTVDTKMWPEFRALFTDDATLHFPEAFDRPMPIEEGFTMVVETLGNAVSIHHGHMPEIEILGTDEATAIWAMEDEVYLPGDPEKGIPDTRIVGAGHYHERYRREDGRWKIAALRLSRLRHEIFTSRLRTVITGG